MLDPSLLIITGSGFTSRKEETSPMSQEKLSQNYDADPFHRRVLYFIEFARVTQHGDREWHRTNISTDINPFITHPAHERLYHTTRVYAPYSLQTAVRVLLRPTRIRTVTELWDGAYGFSSLAEKTRMSNLRQHILLSYFKTLSVGPAGIWSPRDIPLGRPALNQLG